MNILLWALQAVLGLLYVAGGYYKAFNFEKLADQFTAIPHGGWRVLGVIETAAPPDGARHVDEGQPTVLAAAE